MKKYFTTSLLALLLASGSARAQWATQTSNTTSNLFGVKFYDANRGFAVGWAGSNSDILRTTDGGKTWKKTSVPNTYLFSVDMLDTTTIWIAGYDFGCSCALIKKSADGGKTWKASDDMHIPESFGLYNIIMTGNGKGYVSGYNGAIVQTNNNWGSGYTVGKTGTNSAVFRVLEMAKGDTGYAGGGDDFSMMDRLYSTTNGKDWSLKKDFSGSFSIGSLYFVNGKTGFMVGSNGMPVIMKTTDGGDNWTEKYKGTNNQLLVTDAALGDSKSGYAITSGGELLRTDDAGESWKSEQKFNGKYLSAIYVVNKDVAYAVGQNGVIVKRSSSAGIDPVSGPSAFDMQIQNSGPGAVRVNIAAPEGVQLSLKLTDMQGRVIENIVPVKISGSQAIPATGLKKGVYVLTAASRDSYVSRKFIIVD